jgi:autotransporter-associated beta strand protein
MYGPIRTGCLLVCLVVASLANPAVAQTVRTIGPFSVSFYNAGQSDDSTDGPGVQDWTSQQMDDAAAAISAWSSRILNVPARPIKLHLFWNDIGGTTLGQTESPRAGNGTKSWTFTEQAWRDNVSTPSTMSYDARMTFDAGTAWNFGSQAPASTDYDFRGTLTHELGHALGFVSTYAADGTATFSSQGLSAWDKFLTDGTNRPLAGRAGTPGTFNVTKNPVSFSGPNAVAAYGNWVPIYAPAPYESGSSLSHLDETRLPNALLSPSIAPGQSVRVATDLEWAIMKDLGWSIATAMTWTKGANTLNWSGTANWSPGGVPDQTSSITFTSSGLAGGDVVSLGGNRTVQSLTLDSGSSFTLGGSESTLALRSGNITRTTASSGIQTIASPVTLGANAIWSIDGDGKLLISGAVNGSNVYKLGLGMVALSGTMNLTGDMTLSDGDLTLATGGLLTARSISGDGSLNFDGGSLSLTNSSTLHLRGIRVGKEAGGSVTIGPSVTLSTDVFLTIGRDSGGQGTLVNQSGTVTAAANLFVGVFPGSYGAFIQQTDTSSGAAAPTTTVAGATAIGGDSLGDSGGVGVMQIKSGTYSTKDLLIGPAGSGTGGSGTLTQTGGTMTVSGNLLLADGEPGTYNLNGGTLQTGSLARGASTAALNFGGGTLKATAAFTTSVPMTVNTGGGTIDTAAFGVTISGAIGGAGSLQKIGSGTLTLAAANSLSGALTPKTGALALGNANALQSSTLNLAAGDTGSVSFGSLTAAALGGLKGPRNLTLPGGFALTVGGNGLNTTYSGVLGGTGASLNKVGSGALTLTAANTYSAGTTITAGMLQVGSAGNLGSGGVTLAGGTLDIHSAAAANLGAKNVSVTGNSGISATGAGSSVKHTLGSINLSGNRTLTVSGDSGLTTGAVTATDTATIANNAAGLLSLPSFQETAAASKTITFGGSGRTAITGAISQNGANALTLVKTDGGRLTLSGSDSYTGGTQVLGGVLEIASAGALPRGRGLSIGAGGGMLLSAGLTQPQAEPIPEPGTLVLLAAGSATLLLAWLRRRHR